MKVDELERAVLKLDPQARARLAEILLRSLDSLSQAESAGLWAEEARRRDAELDQDASQSRPAEDVIRDSRAKLK